MDAPLPTTAGAGSTTCGDDGGEEDGFPMTNVGNDGVSLSLRVSLGAQILRGALVLSEVEWIRMTMGGREQDDKPGDSCPLPNYLQGQAPAAGMTEGRRVSMRGVGLGTRSFAAVSG
jgi:hypothetical protein